MTPNNPYLLNPVGEEPAEFYGRARLLDYARQMLCGRKPSGHLELFGPRRMGKTSLLHRIRHEVRAGRSDVVLVAWSSDQCERGSQTAFADGLSRKLLKEFPVSTPVDSVTPWDRFDQLLDQVTDSGRRVFLFLDEFQGFVDKLGLGTDQFSWLRGLTQDGNARLTLVISTRTPLDEYPDDMISSDLPNIFHREFVGPLDRSDALAMVAKPAAAGGPALPHGLPEKVFDLCHGHPFLTARCAFNAADRLLAKQALDPENDDFFNLCLRSVSLDFDLLAKGIPPAVHDDTRRLVEASYNRSYSSEAMLDPSAKALVRSGLCTLEDTYLRPCGRLAAGYLNAKFGTPADPQLCQKFMEILLGVERELQRHVNKIMKAAHGAGWETIVLPAGVLGQAQRNANGGPTFSGLTFGQLLDVATKVPSPSPEFTTALDHCRAVRVNQVRATITHPKHLSLNEIQSAMFALNQLRVCLLGPS